MAEVYSPVQLNGAILKQPADIKGNKVFNLNSLVLVGSEDSVASATTPDFTGLGSRIYITGTTTITSFAGMTAGQIYFLRFAGTVTVTNGSDLITKSGSNVTTATNKMYVVFARSATACSLM